MANLYETLRASFPKTPDAVFLTQPSGAQLTYAALDRLTAGLANRLVGAGARPGDRIMMQVEKTPQAVALYLAAIRAGLVFIPLNMAYARDELAYLCGDAQPSVVVSDSQSPFAAQGFPLPSGCARFTLEADGTGSLTEGLPLVAFTTVAAADDDIAAILYTSGTTGKPKGAMLTHANLASNAITLCDYWGITGQDVLLHALPIFHTHGLFVALNTTLISGGQMIFLPRFDTDAVFAALPRATTMMGVPTFYTRMLDDPRLTRAACAHMRLFVSGSAPLLAETFARFHDRSGHTILERYGMTETNMIASNPLAGERRAGTVGHPLPGVSVRITDDRGQTRPAGEPGGIEVKGPNVFKGYWQNPEKTRAEFRADGYFITGDVGRVDKEGYLSIVGRSKDLIITGGFNVYPKEVEDVINAMDGVAESAVIGLPHHDFGEGVVAVVIPEGPPLSAEKIIARCRDHLAAFKSPKAVIFLDALPRNAMGKVEKAKLRVTYEAHFSR
ncbi:MAG: AMP-binding protein [Qingshengfaniella sp.]